MDSVRERLNENQKSRQKKYLFAIILLIILVIVLSCLCGYIYQFIGHKIDLNNHPREYMDFVEKYSQEYGVPEYIAYSIILTESDFTSNKHSADGKIGLMQITPEVHKELQALTKESAESGILYDPETNIRYGIYRLSHLFTKYNRWKTVIAVYVSDEDTVQLWLDNPACVDENGNLKTIPDPIVADKVDLIEKKAEMYRKLYYNE